MKAVPGKGVVGQDGMKNDRNVECHAKPLLAHLHFPSLLPVCKCERGIDQFVER